MIDVNGTLESAQRNRFAAAGMCWRAVMPAGAAALAGVSRHGRSMPAYDPGGGPGV